MTAISLLLLVISFSLVITRSAAVMLELTGMSRDSARFQARAAYCGVGYSSKESDGVINHPLRRQIVRTLMLVGNAGTATVVATLVLSFTALDSTQWQTKLALLFAGLIFLLVLANSSWVDRKMSQFIHSALRKFTKLDLNDYLALLHLSQGYSVLEVKVAAGDWLGGADLKTLNLPKEGVLVLGIQRVKGDYIGAPSGSVVVNVGDVLTMYGQLERLEELNRRRLGREGSDAHELAVDKQSKDRRQP